MGTTTVVVEDELLTTTAFSYLKELRSMKDRPYPAVDDLLKKGMQTQEGGERVIIPWEVDDHSEATQISTGYEGLVNTARPTMRSGHEDWAYIAQPVFLSRRDQLITRGKHAMIDRWKTRVKNVERHIHRILEQVMFRTAAASGSYAGHAAFSDFLSLNGADQSTGFIEAAASGTNTLHNVGKATYPASSHPQFHNLWYDGAGSFSANGLIGLYRMIVDSIDNNGDINPSDYQGYISKEAAGHLKRALRSAERYVDAKDMDDGARMSMMYHGIPLTITGRLPNSGSATTADPWSVLFVNWKEGVRFIGQSGAVMSLDPVERIPGTLVQVAVFHLMGQLVCPKPGLNALLSDADAWT